MSGLGSLTEPKGSVFDSNSGIIYGQSDCIVRNSYTTLCIPVQHIIMGCVIHTRPQIMISEIAHLQGTALKYNMRSNPFLYFQYQNNQIKPLCCNIKE